MRIITAHQGQLHTDTLGEWNSAPKKSFTTGLSALDDLLPNKTFARGAVHELLTSPAHPPPLFVALFLARSAINQPQMNADERRLTKHCHPEPYSAKNLISQFWRDPSRITAQDDNSSAFNLRSSASICGSKNLSGSIIWCDPLHKLYPPAIASLGVPLDRLFLLHPKSIADENWAIAECLRCKGVCATIASPRRLSRIEARRFQLAAERGGGIGILIRPHDRTHDRNGHIYSATTRWLVAPSPGERTIQRWTIQLLHGHGGQVGQGVILEHHRENNSIKIHSVRAIEKLVDRSLSKTA